MVEWKLLHTEIDEERLGVKVPEQPEQWMEHFWELHGQRDARFPFWLEIWPCAFGLYRFFSSRNIALDPALEIGCGCGVLAQVLQKLPGRIWHTDLMPEACAFTKQCLGSDLRRQVFAMDFNHTSLLSQFPVIFGADLFYDDGLVKAICAFVSCQLAPGGSAYFADPGRAGREGVPLLLKASGLQMESIPWTWRMDGVAKAMNIYRLFR